MLSVVFRRITAVDWGGVETWHDLISWLDIINIWHTKVSAFWWEIMENEEFCPLSDSYWCIMHDISKDITNKVLKGHFCFLLGFEPPYWFFTCDLFACVSDVWHWNVFPPQIRVSPLNCSGFDICEWWDVMFHTRTGLFPCYGDVDKSISCFDFFFFPLWLPCYRLSRVFRDNNVHDSLTRRGLIYQPHDNMLPPLWNYL